MAAASHDVADTRTALWGSSHAHAMLVLTLRGMPLSERARAARVCRVWRDAAACPSLWRVLRFDDCGAVALSDAGLARLCARAGAALREVHLAAMRARTDSGCCASMAAYGWMEVEWPRGSAASRPSVVLLDEATLAPLASRK
jgi:hypothetical protein